MKLIKKPIVEYRQYELPVDFPVILLEGDYWKISKVRNQRLHFHNCYEIGICHSFSGYIVFDDKQISFSEGDMTFIPPYFPHTTYSDLHGESHWSYLFFDLEELLAPLQEAVHELDIYSLLHTEHMIFSKNLDPASHFLLCQMISEIRSKKSLYPQAFATYLYSLFLNLTRTQNETVHQLPADETKKRSLIIAPALRYIQRNYMNDFSVEALGDLCHISLTHFRRNFLEVMGDTPWNYVNTIRIEKACILLKTTNQSNLTISETVGFQSISSYNKYFRRIMKVTPSEFRNPRIRSYIQPQKKSVLEYRGWTRPEVLTETSQNKP